MEDINAFDLLRYDIDRHMDDCDEDYSDIIHTLYRTIDNIMDICRNTLSIYGKTFKDFKYAVKKIKQSPYSGTSSTSVDNLSQAWHAQYIADIKPIEVTENGKKAAIALLT